MFEWSEAFIERGGKRERIQAIKVMLKLGLTKEQILTEYTKEEVDKGRPKARRTHRQPGGQTLRRHG